MHYIYSFFIMFGFWILLSGKFDLFHLTLGVLASILVAFLSADLQIQDRNNSQRLAIARGFFLYIPWLLWQIVLSTLHVTYLALHPRMKQEIEPQIVTFKTRLKSDIAQVALANSITLTPGTITIRIEDGIFHVHAISNKLAAELPGDMETRLQRVFREN